MALARVLPLADIILIPPRGSYHLFLLRVGQWHPLWAVSHQIFFCPFFYSGILVANHLPPFSGSWEGCHHLGVLKGHSPDWGSHCISGGNPSGFQIQTPHRSSYSQHTLSFFFCLVRWGWGTWLAQPPIQCWEQLEFSTSVGLVTWPVGRSFGVSTSDFVKRTVASPPSGVSAVPGRVSLTSTLAGEVVDSAGGVSSLDGHLNDEGMVLCAPRLL